MDGKRGDAGEALSQCFSEVKPLMIVWSSWMGFLSFGGKGVDMYSGMVTSDIRTVTLSQNFNDPSKAEGSGKLVRLLALYSCCVLEYN